MARVAFCVILIIVCGLRLHAEEQLPDHQPSALPWLNFDSLSATRERPLFAPDRRKSPPLPAFVAPSLPIAASPAPQEEQKPQLTLMGIIVAPSETFVLLRDRRTSEELTVRSGDAVGAWRVLVDSNYAVIFKDANREFKLEMFAQP